MTGTRHDQPPLAWHLRTTHHPQDRAVRTWVRSAGARVLLGRRGRAGR